MMKILQVSRLEERENYRRESLEFPTIAVLRLVGGECQFIDLMDRTESWLNIIRDRLINARRLLASQNSLIDLLFSINKNLG